jgi:uncharacterized protein
MVMNNFKSDWDDQTEIKEESNMRKLLIIASLFIALAGANAQVGGTDYTAVKIGRYKTNAVQTPAFIPLEIGEIKPEGWLLDWAETAANGITGHLDEYVDVYKYGWKGFGFQARGVNEDGTGWPLEQCSYWLDGATKLAYILNDTMLIRKTSSRLNMVVDGVLKGGETFIYWKPGTIVNDGFNNWGHGLMGRALVSYYQATHDPRILQALVKVYKKFPLRPDSDEFMQLNRGTTNIDAMTETFVMSGERPILDSIVSYSKKDISIRTVKKWNNINSSFIPDKDYNGVHGVSFYEILRVPAMMYTWTGDKNELTASENILQWGEKSSLLPLGVCSSEEYLAGIGSIRNIETCNVPTSMWSFLWMLRLTGDSRWSDKIESVFFNAGAGPVARDFKTMCYYQSPNRFSNKLPEVVPVPGKGDMDFTDHGHEVLCCVGNVNNTIPDYISCMWMATLDDGLAATLYGPCTVSKKIKDVDVKIESRTSYPFEEKIQMNVSLSKDLEMPLYFRVPAWCRSYSLSVNGKNITTEPVNGFIRIDRVWKNNDRIIIALPMSVEAHKGVENSYPRIEYFLNGFGNLRGQSAAVNADVANPFEYITYGPLLFSLPLAEANLNQESGGSKFNYALNVNAGKITKDITVVRKPMAKKWTWQLGDSPVQLKVKAREIPWTPTQLQPLPSGPVKSGKPANITLVPYGLTKFRVTMFPVTDESVNPGK